MFYPKVFADHFIYGDAKGRVPAKLLPLRSRWLGKEPPNLWNLIYEEIANIKFTRGPKTKYAKCHCWAKSVFLEIVVFWGLNPGCRILALFFVFVVLFSSDFRACWTLKKGRGILILPGVHQGGLEEVVKKTYMS